MIEFIDGPEDDYYLMIEPFVLRGEIDRKALGDAVAAVMDRHDILRAVYPAGQDVYQVVGAGKELLDTVLHHRAGYPTPVDDAVAEGLAWAGRPLRLAEEPPLRLWLAPVDDTTTVLVVAGHHLVFDAWTFMLFYEDLAKEYASARAGGDARPRPAQYAQAWTPEDPSALEGWSAVFGRDYRAVRKLAAAARTPTGPGVTLERTWPGLGQQVISAARQLSITPYVLGTAAMLHALAEMLGDDEVILGSAYAGRTTAAAADAVGYYSTTLFLGQALSAHKDLRGLVTALNTQVRGWQRAPRIQWEDLLPRYDAQNLYPVKFGLQPIDLAQRQPVLQGVKTSKAGRRRGAVTARRPVDVVAAYDRDSVTVAMTVRLDAIDDRRAEGLIDAFEARLRAFTAPQ